MSVRNIPSTAEKTETKRVSWYDIVALVLCLTGVGISSYLTYTKFFNQSIVCVEGGGCDIVASSPYASFVGVPVSLLGLLMYLTLAAGVIARWWFNQTNNLIWRGRLDWALFISSLLSVVFSGYLIAMSLFVIKATCIWCLASATTITVLFALFAVRLWRSVEEI